MKNFLVEFLKKQGIYKQFYKNLKFYNWDRREYSKEEMIDFFEKSEYNPRAIDEFEYKNVEDTINWHIIHALWGKVLRKTNHDV